MDSGNAVVQLPSVKWFAVSLIIALSFAAASTAPAKPKSAEDEQFRRWLVQYLRSDPDGDNDLQNLVYGYALVDLNGDGRKEALVWARDRICGTGGCDLDIFIHENSGWRLFTSANPEVRPPILLLTDRHHGWRDLAAWQAGGGVMRPYEGRFRFNGKEYKLVEPADWTGVRPRPPKLNGRILIKDATMSLFPSKCHRLQEAPSVFGPLPVESHKAGSC